MNLRVRAGYAGAAYNHYFLWTRDTLCVEIDSHGVPYLKHACKTHFLTESGVGGHLFVCDELPHADEYMPDLGGPDVQVAVKVQKLEGGRYFVVGKFCRPTTRHSSFSKTRIYVPTSDCRSLSKCARTKNEQITWYAQE